MIMMMRTMRTSKGSDFVVVKYKLLDILFLSLHISSDIVRF